MLCRLNLLNDILHTPLPSFIPWNLEVLQRLSSIFIIAISLSFLSGCQNLLSYSLLNAKSYPASQTATKQILDEFGAEKRQFCDSTLGCIDYYFAPSLSDRNSLDMNLRADFTGSERNISLDLKREELGAYSGNIILLHGFRGSKEWMLTSAGYFQFLGFDVYIFDLLGHGELDVAKGFGVKDSEYISRFAKANIDQSKPTIAVGYSMGGLLASRLNASDIAAGAILQAPITRFDESLVGYFRDNQPWYSFIFSDHILRDGAQSALNKTGVQLEQTDTLNLINSIDSPTLIFASTIDSVSPYSSFRGLSQDKVVVYNVESVQHAYMSMIGSKEHEQIVDWLNEYIYRDTN